MSFEWSPSAISRLTELWQEGHTARAIAEMLGPGELTRNAILGQAHRRKLPARTTASKPDPAKERRVGSPPRRPARAPLMIARPEYRPKPCALFELTPISCRWPIGDPRQPGFHFCGAEKEFEASYCPTHADMAYRERSA